MPEIQRSLFKMQVQQERFWSLLQVHDELVEIKSSTESLKKLPTTLWLYTPKSRWVNQPWDSNPGSIWVCNRNQIQSFWIIKRSFLKNTRIRTRIFFEKPDLKLNSQFHYVLKWNHSNLFFRIIKTKSFWTLVLSQCCWVSAFGWFLF